MTRLGKVCRVAIEEWRYWLRSYLMLSATILFAVLVIVASVINALRIETANHQRVHQQNEAEETFLEQPDRHPHRMVHYGHYAFRATTPLAIFDSGLDSVIGQSIFLEGHRQNSAMFAESASSANLGGLSWLSPALMYQVFAPLLIVLLAHGAIVREREAKSLSTLLAQGVSAQIVILGKVLALLSFIFILLLPLIMSGVVSLVRKENILAVFSLFGVYLTYLVIWAILSLFISTILNKRSTVIAVLIALWLSFTLLAPSLAVNIASRVSPIAGKIETDLSMLNDIRKLGDGHNANDPAFQKMRADVLKKFDVERVEDLPINFRGLVATESERKLAKVMNDYAQSRMTAEKLQTNVVSRHAWLTPTLAIASASRAIAGTDLEHYHRFLNEAETLRVNFVQGLNRAHVDQLSYQDDINRNKDEASGLKARIDASNWQVLDHYKFETATVRERLYRAKFSTVTLISWLSVLLLALFWSATRIKP